MMKWLFMAVPLAMGLWWGPALAQDYPTRPVTVVVPFAAGGPADTAARLVAGPMSKDLGRQIVMENVGGAGGTLGAARVARAEADGYTLLLHNLGIATSATLYRTLPYDTLDAFAYVGLVTEGPMAIVARKDFAPADLKGLVEYVKAGKGATTIGNAGVGSAAHLCGMLFMKATGTPLTAVPYTGTRPAMKDLLAGKIDIMCDQTMNAAGEIRSGAVKTYAVTTPSRLDALPGVPTADEAGLADLRVSVWHGLFAPKGTPAGITERLSRALRVALKDPRVVARLAELGTAPAAADDATPAALKARLKGEVARWKPVIEAAGQYAD